MIDFLFGALLVALLVRGWLRGLVREALDLGVLIVGLFLAFRLRDPVGRLVESLAGTSPQVSRIIGAVAVFLAVSITAGILSHLVHRTIRHLPGVPALNRLGGAALGAVWGAVLGTVALSVLAVAPLPSVVARQMEDSTMAGALTNPDGVAQRVIGGLSGDRIMRTVLELQRRFGSGQVIVREEEQIAIPAAPPESLETDPGAADAVYDLVNQARVEAGLDPLAWAPALADVAGAHADAMYTAGFFGHHSPASGTVADRVRAAGLPFVVVGENLALGVTARDVHHALMRSDGHRANVLAPEYRRIGVGVVAGPLGLMTVQVFTG